MTLLSILLSMFFVTPTDKTLTNDTLHHKEIKEITIYSISNDKIAVPMVEVSKTELIKNDFRTPADALQTQTGIALSRDGGWATGINVRGMGEQRLMILVDGDRLQTATDVAGAMSTVSMAQLGKIEVVKGAGSVLFGSGAVGGVINFVSDRPTYTALKTLKGNLQSSYSSVNNMFGAAASVDVTNESWYFRATGSYRAADSYKMPTGLLKNSQFNDGAWSLSGGLRNKYNHEILFGYNEYYVWDAGIPGGAVFKPVSVVRYSGVRRRQFNGEYIINNVSDLIRRLSVKAYNQNIHRNVENVANPVANPLKVIVPSSVNATSGVKATAELYFNDYNTMTVGAEGWIRKVETKRDSYTYGTDTLVVADQPTPKADVLNTGIFALYKKVIDPKYFLINMGARLDFFKTSNDSLFKELYRYKLVAGKPVYDYTGRTLRMKPSDQLELSYALNVDFIYTPSYKNKFALSLSSAYRVASVEERYKYIDQAGTLRVGNPDLKPEMGAFTNFSYTHTDRKWMVRTDVFANYLFDMIAEVPGVYTNINGQPVHALITSNINKALYAGAEVEANWNITRHFSAMANASYVLAKDVTSGDYLIQIPPLHGLVKLNYAIDKRVKLGLSAKWATKQTQAAETESKTAGHLIYNFDVQSANIALGMFKLNFVGGIENILDKAYKNHLFATRGLDFYEPGRNFFAKVNLKW